MEFVLFYLAGCASGGLAFDYIVRKESERMPVQNPLATGLILVLLWPLWAVVLVAAFVAMVLLDE